MTYYLSGALASQNSASISQAITGALPLSDNDFVTTWKDNLSFDISPSGEYMLKATFMGTGSFASSPGNDYDPGIIIYQSGSINGFEQAGFVRNKGSRALDSALTYADLNNMFNAQFLSDGVIVWAGGSYDPQDGTSTRTDGIFGIITGSGTNWGLHKVLSGSTQAGTAQSRDDNLGAESDIGDFNKTDAHGLLIAANNKYNDTLATRVAVYNGLGHASPNHPQGYITIFQQSGGDWSFHSQFNQLDIDDYINGSFSSAMSVHDMTWIDENNLVVVYYSDSSTDYSFTFAFTFNASTSKWEVSGYDGSAMSNYAYRLTRGHSNPHVTTSGTQGIRFVEYDPFSERLLMGYQGDSIWMFQSQSNWLRDDLYGNSLGKGTPSEEEDHGHAGSSGAPPFGNKNRMRFAFADGRTTIVGIESDYGENGNSPSKGADTSLVYHESSSASGWNDYSIAAVSGVYQGKMRKEYFSTGSLTLAAESKTGWGIAPYIYAKGSTDTAGMKTAFTMNSRNGGSGNIFAYHEADPDSTGGSSQRDTQRLLIGNFGAFPAANPALESTVTQTVGTSGGTVKAGGTTSSPTTTLTIAASALSGDTTIGIDLTLDADPQSNGLGAAGVTDGEPYSKVISLTPHGQKFSSAVTVQFNLEGSGDGTCPSDLSIWKANDTTGVWYELPSSFWSCTDGVITISTTSFSRYVAIGGNNMARTRQNNNQIGQLSQSAMVVAQAIDITGSQPTATSVNDGDHFLLHASGELPQKITAANLATYMGGNVTVSSSEGQSENFRLTFVDPSANTAGLAVDGDADKLVWNPSSDTLTVGGALTATTLSGSSTLNVVGASTFGPADYASISAAGVISGSGDSTIHKITMNQLVAATADINGGSVDGATIGASSQSSVKATTLSGSSTLHVAGVSSFGPEGKTVIAVDGGLTIAHFDADWTNAGNTVADLGTVTTVDINGGSVDGATIGAASQSSVKATTLSGSSTLSVEGAASFGPGAKAVIAADGGLTIAHFDANWTNAGITVADLGEVTTVDINGGSIDGATIGAASQSSVKATTLSGSSTLSVEGVASFGPGALTTISAAGVVSGSGVSTLHRLDADRIAVEVLDVNTINSNTITQNSLEIEDFNVLAGLSGSSSQLDGGGFQIGGSQGDTLGSLVWNDSDQGVRIVSGSTAIAKVNSSGVQVTGILSGSGVLTVPGVTVGTAVLDEDDLEKLDGITNGTVAASKAVVVDSDKDINGFRSITASTNVYAGAYFGDGSGLTNVGATIVASSDLAVGQAGLPILFASASAGTSKDLFIDPSDITFSPLTNKFHVSGAISSSAGLSTLDRLSVTADFTAATADINGGSIDGATIGAASQSSVEATTLSGSSTLHVAGVSSFGPEAKTVIAIDGGLTIAHFDANWTNAGITVADLGTVTTVDINGGSVDGATIGAASQSSVKATTLSGSSTLNVAGVSTFGPANYASISADGIISGSGAATIFSVTADRLLVSEGELSIGGTKLAATAAEINAIADLDGGTAAAIDVSADHFIFRDGSATGAHKIESIADFMSASAGTGLVASNGVLNVQGIEQVLFSGSSNMTAALTASVTAAPLDGTLQVFLNGMLQTNSGSLAATNPGVFDYKTSGTGVALKILLEAALDDDDILTLHYIKNNQGE